MKIRHPWPGCIGKVITLGPQVGAPFFWWHTQWEWCLLSVGQEAHPDRGPPLKVGRRMHFKSGTKAQNMLLLWDGSEPIGQLQAWIPKTLSPLISHSGLFYSKNCLTPSMNPSFEEHYLKFLLVFYHACIHSFITQQTLKAVVQWVRWCARYCVYSGEQDWQGPCPPGGRRKAEVC